MQVDEQVVHVEQVAQQGGEGEQHHEHRDEHGADGAEGLAQGGLHIGGAGQGRVRLHAGAQAHEGGAGAQQQGVNEHGQHLHQALLDRVAHIGAGRRVGSAAAAGLVGVQAALDAVHHAGGGEAAEDGPEVKGIAEDAAQHLGQQGDVGEDDHQRHQHVHNAHHGHQQGGDLYHPLAAAQQAVAHQHSQHTADDPGGGFGVVEAVHAEGGLQVVGGQHVEAHRVGGDHEHAEQHSQQAAVQSGLDVVGGAAVAAVAVAVTLFVDLGQGALHKGGSTAHQGDDPHPEHSAVTAQADGGGNAHNVAGAHAGRGGHHQRLEGGYVALLAGLFGDYADGFAKHTQLDEFGAEGVPQATGQQQDDQQLGIHEVADHANDLGIN